MPEQGVSGASSGVIHTLTGELCKVLYHENYFCRIADVKIQFFHYFLDKRTRLQDFTSLSKLLMEE